MFVLLVRFGVLCALLAVVLGCSASPQLHVFARYLDEHQVAAIQRQFAQSELELHVNYYSVPADMSHSSVVYSPLLLSPNLLDYVVQQFQTLGFEIQTLTPLSTSNHRFTKNALGVYLIPEHTRFRLNRLDLTKTYVTFDCPVQRKLQLNQDMTFQVLFTTPRHEQNNLTLHGDWQIINDSILELRPAGAEWFIYFDVQRSQSRDQISQIEMLSLLPLDHYPMFNNCPLQIGTRY